MDAFKYNPLKEEFDDTCDEVIELLDELGTIEILRASISPSRRFLLDRLEAALRRIDRLGREIAALDWDDNRRIRGQGRLVVIHARHEKEQL